MHSYDISFTTSVNSRGAYRTAIPGLRVVLPSGEACAVQDISAGGLSFTCHDCANIMSNTVLSLSLWVVNKLYIENLHVSVVRRTNQNVVACQFVDLNRQQELRLDKLILEMQKRIIAQKKAKELVNKDSESNSAEPEDTQNDSDLDASLLDAIS